MEMSYPTKADWRGSVVESTLNRWLDLELKVSPEKCDPLYCGWVGRPGRKPLVVGHESVALNQR